MSNSKRFEYDIMSNEGKLLLGGIRTRASARYLRRAHFGNSKIVQRQYDLINVKQVR